VLALIGVITGTIYYLPRAIGRPLLPGGADGSSALATLRAELESRYEADIERLRAETRQMLSDVEADLQRFRDMLRTSTQEQETHLARMRTQVSELDGKAVATLEQALRDVRDHHNAELSRLREAIGAAIAAIAAQRSSSAGPLSRRAEALVELYRLLTKFETTFVSVANPVLLPGEPFTLSADLPAESLRWEAWKEVGNAAFVFADAFALHRLDLDDEVCREITGFIAGIRQLLTRSIYPYLQTAATNAEARQQLRRSLEQLAAEIPHARESLERAYRESV
jgi:DNA repair exonuclease SbcCD ATPase subunit